VSVDAPSPDPTTAPPQCSLDGCTRRPATKGVCRRHRAQVPTPTTTKTAEQFWAGFDPVGDCWEWRSPVGDHGYGVVTMQGQKWLTHRLAYTLMVGDIPAGLQIDHLCRNRVCGNPDHLEAVTPRVNTLRSEGLPAKRAKQTVCQRNHALTPENVYLRPDRLGRMCRQCCAIREARRPPRGRAA
jgi:hypothetical protein